MKSDDRTVPAPSRGPAPNTRGRSAPGTARKIEQSIEYMMLHLAEPLQVATLAAAANTSASHYFALFKRLTGLPPICYFIRLRMQRACELLADESLHVKEVAACLGYDDPFYFSRVFKSVNRVAPTEYRLNRSRKMQRQPPVHAASDEWLRAAVLIGLGPDAARAGGADRVGAGNALAGSLSDRAAASAAA